MCRKPISKPEGSTTAMFWGTEILVAWATADWMMLRDWACVIVARYVIREVSGGRKRDDERGDLKRK